jgi:hypothetical protein
MVRDCGIIVQGDVSVHTGYPSPWER